MTLIMSMFFLVMIGLSFHRLHLLSALLCLEGLMLVIFVGLSTWPNNLTIFPLMTPLIMLTMSACEASLGLSLMIALARSHGSDNLKTLNLLRW